MSRNRWWLQRGALLLFAVVSGLQAQAPAGSLVTAIRSDMEHLAGSELRGRGSATHDEYLAASYVAAQLHAIGLRPGAPDGTYLQQVALPDPLPAAIQQRLAAFEAVPRTVTWNAIGILPGADPELAHQVVLLTAHLDHLGVSRATVTQPSHVYYGADDDASGVTAVLALARNLASGQRPARTVVVACFGSEELGSYGARGFLRQPPVPLQSIVANLEFEMLGRPDPALAPGMLWLTGFERTNLGATLAAHGAPLVADPHPQQGFFQRSDNLTLARDGIVAQTISSFGLHTDYHQPTDTVARIDMNHLIQAITALAPPIRWLANTSWRPQWNPNGKP